jgi:hypothetical protein
VSTATGIRTRVSAVRGRRPSPLDDSGEVPGLERSGVAALAWRSVGEGRSAGPCHDVPADRRGRLRALNRAWMPAKLVAPRLWRNW